MTAEVSKLGAYAITSGRRKQTLSKLAVYAITTNTITNILDLKWGINVSTFETQLDLVWNVNYDPPADVTAYLDELWQVNSVKVTLDIVWDIAMTVDVVANIDFAWNIAQAYANPDDIIVPDYPIAEEWEFKTSVFRSINGTEQRRSLRTNPFIKLGFNALALDENDLRQQRRVMELKNNEIYPVPLFQYFDFLEKAPALQDRVYFDRKRVPVTVGQTVAIIHNETLSTIVRTVTVLHADGATLNSPIPFEIDGYYFINPVRYSRLNTSGGNEVYNTYANASFTFISADRDIAFDRAGNNVVLPTVSGLVLLEKPILADSGLQEEFLSGVKVVDESNATPLLYVDEGTRRKQTVRYLIQRELDPAQMDYWRKFAITVCGQLAPFCVPSFRVDAVPVSTPALGSDEIEVFGTDTANAFANGGYYGVMFDTVNGREYRKAASVSIVGNNSLITLDAPLGSDIGDNDFAGLSFLYHMRLAEDSFGLSHTDTTTVITFDVQMVRA